MQLKNKHKLMISLLSLLLLAKFIFVPLLEWQDEQVLEIERKELQLRKSKNNIERTPKLVKALQDIELQNQELHKYFFDYGSFNKFKLELQQKFEGIFTQHELKVTNFSWVNEIDGKITEARAKITFEGQTANFANLQLAIAKMPELINLPEWEVRIERMSKTSLGQVRGNLLVVIYNITPEGEKV